MIAFQVDDMTCGHCVRAITEAIQNIDKHAKVEIDLARHRVEIEQANADARAFADAISEAGYTPLPG